MIQDSSFMMMEKYELQKLRDLPIEGVAERLGLQVTRHKCLCPFHDDHHASMSFKVSRNTFRCFVCGASGGTIDLVMKCLGKNFREACQWLQTLPSAPPCREGNGYSCNGIYSSPYREGSGVGLFDASRYERFFERPWLNETARKFLFEERRIDPRVVRWCRLTSWRDKQGVPWLQIPYYDQQGKLIGIQNRNLVRFASPRFRFPQGSECRIYNLPVLNRLRPGDTLFIAEGCSDCWSLLSAGYKSIAIPSATLLGKKDAELLQSFGSDKSIRFEMWPDNDAPGERLFMQLREVLPSLVHHQLPLDCKDFSEYYLKMKH
jgi:hypothetical protein